MDIKLICDNKYEFIYQTIGLPVKFENLPSERIIKNNTLVLQPAFHVSLVCIGEIVQKHNITIPNFEGEIINDFCEFSNFNEIKVLRSNDFRFVTRDNLKSVIVMCEISNLNKFFDLINKKYGLNIEYPPTHITLYVLPSKHGIFVTDSKDIKNLTTLIDNPIGHLL